MDTTEKVVDSKSNSKLNSEPYDPEDEGGYNPADPVISVPSASSTSSKHTSSPSALPEVSLLTELLSVHTKKQVLNVMFHQIQCF